MTFHKVSICGATGVGKTCIASRLTRKDIDEVYDPTIGIASGIRVDPDHGQHMYVYDFGGDIKYQNLTIAYIRASNVVLFVYDINELESIRTLELLYVLYKNAGWNSKVIVVGNKQDKFSKVDYCFNGEEFAKKINATHVIISAKTLAGMNFLVENILIDLGIKILEKKKRKKCCCF